MTTQELSALARQRLQALFDKPESAYEHAANALQLLLAAEAAFERLNLLGNADDDAAELRDALCNARIRVYKALVLLSPTNSEKAR